MKARRLTKLSTLALLLASSFVLVQAQSFSVVHNFTGGTDGANPLNGLLFGAGGVMYGTTSAGGAYNNGTVFRIGPTGVFSTLYAFRGGADGSSPQSALIQDATGLLYGTTAGGGAYGGGTVFRIASTTKTTLHSFGSGSDGSVPLGGLAFDSAGNLYGTTSSGGANGNGTVFTLTRHGLLYSASVLYSFGSGTDGNVAEVRPIQIKRTQGGESVIGSGLKVGESVVIDGQLRLVNGAPVTVKQSEPAKIIPPRG